MRHSSGTRNSVSLLDSNLRVVTTVEGHEINATGMINLVADLNGVVGMKRPAALMQLR